MAETDHFLAGALALMSFSLLFGKAPPTTPASRMAFYVSGAATGILLGAIALLLWRVAGRDLAEFGLESWIGDPIITIPSALAWLLALLVWLLLVRKGMFGHWLRGIYSKYENLMPVTRRELLASWGTSMAAGAGEEIIYRGFLLWYANIVAGLPLALIGTSILFGVAHGYQSRFGVLFATAAGMVLGATYLVTDSLLLVMWMHATYNIVSFTSGKWVLGNSPGLATRRGDGARPCRSARD